MSQAFIYPNTNLSSATLTDGTITSQAPTNFSSSASLTNEERATDSSIGSIVTGWASNDALRFDLGASSGANDVVAVRFDSTTDGTEDYDLYGSDNASGAGESTDSKQTNVTASEWDVATFTSDEVRYWFIRGITALTGLSEVLIGNKYTFGQDPEDSTVTEEKINAIDLSSPYSQEYEFANKRGNLRKHWKWQWNHINDSMKSDLETFRDVVELNYKKFLYYDNSVYTWVRMSANSLRFTKVTYGIWNTSMELFEQLQ